MAKMSIICPGCNGAFTRGSSLSRHQKRFPSHSKLTIAGVFKEYNVLKSPITDALCNADLVHLPDAESERRELFGDFVPRISDVEYWKSSYSFDDIRSITLSQMLQRKIPVSLLMVISFVLLNDL
jgi:hypothetical protein